MATVSLLGRVLNKSDYVTDLKKIKELAQQHRDDFEVLSYMLDFHTDVTDKQIDDWVDSIAEPIADAIDCTQCANCCSTLDVYLTQDDAKRFSPVVDIPLETIIDHESAKKVDEWGKFKISPCVFLKDKMCTIYEHRPDGCRRYPVFTPDFRWTLDDITEGAPICPIIFNVLMTLYQRIDELYKK